MDVQNYMEKYQKRNFNDEISGNKWKSMFLVTIIVLIIVLFSYVIAQIYDPALTFVFLSFGVVFSLIYSWIGYYYSADISLYSVSAKEAKGPKFNQLNNMVEGLSLAVGMPKPKVYIMPSMEINAFASGRDPKNAVICVSMGAMEYLTKKELEAVLAHEMGHIVNYDIRFITTTVIMVGLIAIISEIVLHTLWATNDNENKNPIFLIIGILLAIIAPIAANLVQLAVSRKREYMADASSVMITRDNSGLISALRKIDLYYRNGGPTIATKTTSNMMISSPFSASKITTLFSTHPPIEDRIKVLESM